MNLKLLAEKMKDVDRECRIFLEKNEKELLDFLRREDVTAEECLQKEIVFQLLDGIHGVESNLEYVRKDVIREGILGRDKNGEITFNGEILPLMTELEVYVYDDVANQEIWTRVYVGGRQKRYLVGLDREMNLIGMKVRMRG